MRNKIILTTSLNQDSSNINYIKFFKEKDLKITVYTSKELSSSELKIGEKTLQNPNLKDLEKELERVELIPRKLHHDKTKQWLYYFLPNEYAYISYKIQKEVWNLDYAYVPESARGQGVAKNIVLDSLDYLKDKNIKISISCSYIKKIFNENISKYSSLIP